MTMTAKETIATWTGVEPKKLTWHERLLQEKDATGEMSVMGSNGDTRHFWNIKKKKDVKMAEKVFKLFLSKKYRPFRMNEAGDAGEPIEEFDPKAGCILFLPAMQGG